MQYNAQEILADLESVRHSCYQMIIDESVDYIYREKRYATHFSIAVIYTKEPLTIDTTTISAKLRKTDKMICLTKNILCVFFDATRDSSFIKATENLYELLQSVDYHRQYFISTALSKDFDENYLDMVNKLFDRVEYSIEHKLYNSVNAEDYII
ncbi:hypothetical protein [Sulfurimonas sp.]